MSQKRLNLYRTRTGSHLMAFALGQPYPAAPLAKGTLGASLNSYGDGSTLFINVAIPRPNPGEFLGFREGMSLRIYQKKDMPGGLLMMRMLLDSSEVGDIFELPFDAVRQVRSAPETLTRFFTAKKIAVLATLTDTGGKQSRVIAIRLLELPPKVVKRLREMWKNQIDVGLDYEPSYENLILQRSAEELWNDATKI